MTAFSVDQVEANAIAFSFKMGEGYKYIGAPAMPSVPIAPPSTCEPTIPAESNSWHRLHPVGQPDNYFIRMRWDAERKWWIAPLEASGRRVAFTSAYLAAYGWTYVEAE